VVVARRRARTQNEVVRRCEELAAAVREARSRLDGSSADEATGETIWAGEALGALLWALGLAELPPYDRTFEEPERIELAGASLRPAEELEHERAAARLWHWRARTAELEEREDVSLPPRYASLDQLVAATAVRGHQQGLLPPPSRGDFPAYGRVYRHLSPAERDEAHSIALERHHALEWLLRPGEGWNDVPLDT
jgi:hypothetical protein